MRSSESNWDGSPCRTCIASPCCRFLPITKLDPDTEADLEAIAELVRLRFIEVGLREDGSWTAFYTRPCSNLDTRSGGCRVHGTEAQPPICARYDAATCWYRDAFVSCANLGFLRFNHLRMRQLIDRTLFDAEGCVYRIPRWEWMVEEFAGIPLQLPQPASLDTGAFLQLRVPPGYPERPRDWELVQFRTSFPGVELLDQGGDSAFALETEVEVGAPRLPAALPSGLTLVSLRHPGRDIDARMGA